jgi:hypothetical protein
MSATRELVTTLSFNLKDDKLKDFEKRIVDLKQNIIGFKNVMLGAITGIVTASTGLTAFAVNTAKNIKSTEGLAEQTGIASRAIQELELVAQNAGLKVGELSNSFAVFGKVVSKASSSGKLDEFTELGIRLKDSKGLIKDNLTLYKEAAVKINMISDSAKRTDLSYKLFGNSSLELSKVMGQSEESLKKQREEVRQLAYITNAQGIKTTNEFLKSWSEFKIIIDNVRKSLAVKFMPVFIKVSEQFKEWFKANKEVINQGLDRFINILSNSIDILLKTIKILMVPVNGVINLFGGLENTVTILGSVLAFTLAPRIYTAISAFKALSAILLTNPLTITLAAIGFAVGGVVNDFLGWKNGNDSVLGDIFGSWEEAYPKLKVIWESIYSSFETIFSKIYNFGELALAQMIKNIKRDFETILNIVNFIKKLNPFGNNNNIENIDNVPKITRENVKRLDLKTAQLTPLQDNITPMRPPVTSVNPTTVARTSSNVSNKVVQNINETITINVPTGTTEDQLKYISSQIADEIQEQFKYNINRGLDSLAVR